MSDRTRLPVYLVAMPIGDYDQEISPAAREVLGQVHDLFLEPDDAGIARLRRLNLLTDAHRIHRADTDVAKIGALVDKRHPFAILASSGIPGFVDPGHQLVDVLLEHHVDDVELVPVGMSSALDVALCASGIDIQRFIFVGHYPECYRFDRRVVGLGLPLVAFVRGNAIRAWVTLIQRRVPRLHRQLLFRDVRKRGRSHTWIVRGKDALPADLVDDPHADFVVVVSRKPRPDLVAWVRSFFGALTTRVQKLGVMTAFPAGVPD